MASELLLRFAAKFNRNRHIVAHFTRDDEAKQQDRIWFVQDNGRRRVAAMDQFQKYGSG